MPRVQEGTGGRDRNVSDDPSQAMRCKSVPIEDRVHPASAMPRWVGIWEHLGLALSEILQEGVRAEKVKDWDPFVSHKDKTREKPSEERVGREGQ